MTFVTVFRRVPKPITGMIGVVSDADFERCQANLDWLETTGVLVEQFDPARARRGQSGRDKGGSGRRPSDVLTNDRGKGAACNRFRITTQ